MKIRVTTVVQDSYESGKDFSERINKMLEESEKKDKKKTWWADPTKHQFQYTTSSDGRQTCNIIQTINEHR